MEKKIENYAVSFIEAIAAERGRNTKWAAQAVRESASITSEQALAKKVIDLIAPTREALLAAIDGRTVRVRGKDVVLETSAPELRDIEMTLEQRFYFFLSHPTIIFLLFVLGAGALYVEFTHPGAVLPGAVGAVALLLAAIGFSIVPINFTGASLLGLGVLLLLAEVFVPSFGALGVAGMLCVASGALLVFRTAEAPGLSVDRGVVAGAVVALGALMIGLGILVERARRRPVATGAESMIGAVGRVVRRLEPSGKVRVMGELWDAALEGAEAAAEGEEVEIVRLEGLRLVVRPRRRVA
jgi:membrane-bound serine protease (ClpP class)